MATTRQTRTLYNGEVTLHFNPNARNRYEVTDGDETFSPVGCTTVLKCLAKEGLALWPLYEGLAWLKEHPDDFEGAEKAHTIKSDSGKNIGTLVHEAVEAFLAGETLEVPSEAQKPLEAFKKWYKGKTISTEQIVYSRSQRYAGTFDLLCEIGGKIYLCDVKTTNRSRSAPLGIYPEYFIQLGGYSLAYMEAEGRQVDDLLVINVGKDGKLATLTASDLGLSVAGCEDAFLHCLSLYNFTQPLTKVIKERTK